MTTVKALMERTYRQILEPPDAQPASSRLSSTLLVGGNTLVLTTFDVPEDENLVRLGSILEIDEELVQVVEFDSASNTVTVLRAQLGTTEADHAVDAKVKLSPPYPRIDVFNGIRDNIVGLYPDLWTVRTMVMNRIAPDVYPMDDPLGVEIVEMNPQTGGVTVNLDGRIVDNHPRLDGRGIVTNGVTNAGTLWVRYRRRFGTALSVDDSLSELGLEDVWQTLVMVGAAADMVAGRDIPAMNSEWVRAALEAENVRVGTRMSLAGGLAQYRGILMERFKREMRAEDSNKPKVHMRQVYG